MKNQMTKKQIQRRLKEIRQLAEAKDFEAAHSREDDLFQSLVEFVAFGYWTETDLRDIAYEALRSKTIQFNRAKA